MGAGVTQVISQVVHTVQPAVAIPASEGRNHSMGEWVGESHDLWFIGIE